MMSCLCPFLNVYIKDSIVRNVTSSWVITKCEAARHDYNSKFRVWVEIWVSLWSGLVFKVVLCVQHRRLYAFGCALHGSLPQILRDRGMRAIIKIQNLWLPGLWFRLCPLFLAVGLKLGISYCLKVVLPWQARSSDRVMDSIDRVNYSLLSLN